MHVLQMQTNVPGVFAAGDAVTFPLAWRNNRKVNIPHWQMAHAQGTTSPEAAGGGRPSPGPASPRPAPQLLPLGPAPGVCHSRLCSGLSGQPHTGDGAGLLPPPSLDPSSILWAPGPAATVSRPLSLPQPLLSRCPQTLRSSEVLANPCSHPGGRLVGPGPAPHCIPFGPPDRLCEPGCRLQAPGRWPSGPGNPPPPPLGQSLHTHGPGPSAAGTAS